MIENSALKHGWSRFDFVLLTCLFLVSTLIFGRYIDVGGFWWTDEARHAMDGVYFYDLLKDRPFSRLYDYTVEYFVHYPALGLTWYLPFFAFIESLFFTAFGISEATARLTGLFFILLAILIWYIWAKPIWGRLPVFFAVLFFLLNPYVILWGRAVMLEIPALAMMFLALYCFSIYLKKPSHLLSISTGIIIGLMLLTKQLTVLVFPVMLVQIVLSGNWRKLIQIKSLWGVIIVAISLAVVILHAIKFGSTALGSLDAHAGGILSVERITVTSTAMWEAYPLPFKLFIFAGLVAVFKTTRQPSDYLLLSWIISWFVLFTLLSDKYGNTLRYTIYLTPALGLLSMRWFNELTKPVFRQCLIGLLVIFYSGYGFTKINEEPYFVNGYEQAAEYVLNSPSNTPILFCCKHDGNFIFHIRIGDTQRKKIILRADKILVSMAVHKEFGVKSYVNNDQDIYDILDKYGIQTIVAEDKDIVGLAELSRLIDLLETDSFEKVKEINVVSNVPEFSDLHLNIYRYKNSKPILNNEINIPMPHIGRNLHLKIEN